MIVTKHLCCHLVISAKKTPTSLTVSILVQAHSSSQMPRPQISLLATQANSLLPKERQGREILLDNRDLQILGRERLRVPNFLVVKTLSARKPASFWREKRVTVVILVRGFAKMSSCQNKSTTRQQFWHFSISKKAQVTAIRITEKPILLTKSKINLNGL